MAFSDSVGLLFRIKADSSDADSELKNFAGKLTGTSEEGVKAFSALGEAAGPMGIAIAAGAAAATIALTATIGVTIALTEKLYDLAKSSSEFGSKIHDAAQQAGIGAETMSALKIAAEQSGSSLEKVAGAVAKFDTLLGQAENGNKKAEATLKQYGITAEGTEQALAQAVRTIALMSNSSEQAAAAAALFKDRTGEILPVIKSFDGDLPALMKKLSDLGLIMSQEDADAADAFGDQIDTLNLQLDSISHTIGTAVMPAFSQFFSSLSAWLAENKSEITSWANTVGSALNRVMIEMREFVTGARNAHKIAGDIAGGNFYSLGVDIAQDQTDTDYYNKLRANNGTTAAGGIGASIRSRGGGEDKKVRGGGGRTPRDTSAADAARDAREAAAEAKRQAQERLAEAKELEQAETALFNAEAAKRLAIAKEYADVAKKTAVDLARYEESLEVDKLNFKIEQLKKYLKAVEADGTPVQIAKVQNELKVLEENKETLRATNAKKEQERTKDQTELEKKEYEKRLKNWHNFLQKKMDDQQKYDDEADRAAKEKADLAKAQDEAPLHTGVSGGIAGQLGVNLPSIFGNTGEIKKQGEFIKSIYQDVASTAGQAIGSMVEGLAGLVTQWITTGHFSAKAALQMAAGVALSLAMQAGVKAIFELAEGWAASAAAAAMWWNPPAAAAYAASAGMHFAAAGIYGTVAGVAAVAGVGLGLASRAVGNDKASDSFKGATGTATGSSNRNTSGQGGVYSSQEDLIQETGANRPGPLGGTITLNIRTNDSHIVDVIQKDVGNNGKLRGLIVNTAVAA